MAWQARLMNGFSNVTGTLSGPAIELQDSSLITSTIDSSFTDYIETVLSLFGGQG